MQGLTSEYNIHLSIYIHGLNSFPGNLAKSMPGAINCLQEVM